MASKLKQEIAKLEQEINTLAQTKLRIERGDTVEKVNSELNVLEMVVRRLALALPSQSTEPKAPRKPRTRNTGLPKPNGKAKEATS